LGPTGRNFAAGMSGGIAYVYDVKQQFKLNVNAEMVDLDPMDKSDAKELHDMITLHYAYTGSTVAKFVLDDFENQVQHFVKVFPRDYKKVLKQAEALQASSVNSFNK
jgi:glutamate synthase (NADPH/NADH) large chain